MLYHVFFDTILSGSIATNFAFKCFFSSVDFEVSFEINRPLKRQSTERTAVRPFTSILRSLTSVLTIVPLKMILPQSRVVTNLTFQQVSY